MKKYVLLTIATAFFAEVFTSWWIWTSSPYDSLDLLYENSFLVYERNRLLPWVISLGAVLLLQLIIHLRRRSKVALETVEE